MCALGWDLKPSRQMFGVNARTIGEHLTRVSLLGVERGA